MGSSFWYCIPQNAMKSWLQILASWSRFEDFQNHVYSHQGANLIYSIRSHMISWPIVNSSRLSMLEYWSKSTGFSSFISYTSSLFAKLHMKMLPRSAIKSSCSRLAKMVEHCLNIKQYQSHITLLSARSDIWSLLRFYIKMLWISKTYVILETFRIQNIS